MVTIRQEWLDLTSEDPIDPDLPICDPHHHLWDHPDPNSFYPGRYLLDELLEDIGGGHNIVQTVFLQCGSMYRKGGPKEMKSIGETEFVQGIAAQSASGQYGPTRVAAGIVGYADLTLGEAVRPVLEAQIAASRNRFRGIRNGSTWDASAEIMGPRDAPKGLLADARFREGFACLNEYGLSFDAWLFHPQISELADLAGAFPDTTIILNHIGGLLGIGPYAGKREEVFRDWKRGLTELATHDNVYVKLGGLGMTISGFGWNERPAPPDSTELAEAMGPYYKTCIELFGADHCMFESNFPVDKASYSYTVMWNAFKRIAKDVSAEERNDLFYNTAVSAYRLPSGEEE